MGCPTESMVGESGLWVRFLVDFLVEHLRLGHNVPQ